MKNIKNLTATFVMMMALMVGTSFAAPGLYVSDFSSPEPTEPCTITSETSYTDGIVNSFTGIIVHGFTGIIVHGVADSSDETCGIIVHG